MSDYHRHNPEYAEAIDRIFGVRVTPLSEAVIDPPDDEDLNGTVEAPCGDCGKVLEWSKLDGPLFRCSPCNRSLTEAFSTLSRMAFEPAPEAA